MFFGENLDHVTKSCKQMGVSCKSHALAHKMAAAAVLVVLREIQEQK